MIKCCREAILFFFDGDISSSNQVMNEESEREKEKKAKVRKTKEKEIVSEEK